MHMLRCDYPNRMVDAGNKWLETRIEGTGHEALGVVRSLRMAGTYSKMEWPTEMRSVIMPELVQFG